MTITNMEFELPIESWDEKVWSIFEFIIMRIDLIDDRDLVFQKFRNLFQKFTRQQVKKP